MINDNLNLKWPSQLGAILSESQAIGFSAFCEDKTGVLLRAMAGSKPGGRILELGTGTGVAACWMLDGADPSTTFVSVEMEEKVHDIAKRQLQSYQNAVFILQDACQYLDSLTDDFDLVFADTFPGKFSHRRPVLDHIKLGGFYIIDDLLPQSNWPTDDHPIKVRDLISALEQDGRFQVLKLNWASGLMVCVKTSR